MLFAKADLQARVLEGDYVSNTTTGNSRWSTHHRMIFTHDNRFYAVDYSQGATEYQCEEPFEYEPDMVECREVVQEDRVIQVWVPVA